MNSLTDLKIQSTLQRLHAESNRDVTNTFGGLIQGLLTGKLKPSHMSKAYIAVSANQGKLLYTLARSISAKNIIEFGTSFGISAIYLGAAARDTGGRVITTEIEPNKINIARKNIADAGLDSVVELWEGDASATLRAAPAPIDMLFLDGWTDLYLPLIKILEPKFRRGAILVTDNADFPGTQPFLHYLNENPAYVTQRLRMDKGGTEFSCYLSG
jgi:predicted O-methyltransferase YrrM